MQLKKPILEVCANGIESALNAQNAGVDRIELCEMLEVGGVTPRRDYIKAVREKLSIPVHVLIRPRAGDFFYSESEFNVMRYEVEMCKELKADGIVVGILNSDLTVDINRCDQLIELAHPLPLTFHRAFDLVRDPFKSLEELIELGFERILTSGQKSDCLKGAEIIARLVNHAVGRITIMAGGGITQLNIAEVIDQTGAEEFHFSAKKTMPDGNIVSSLEFITAIKAISEETFWKRT